MIIEGIITDYKAGKPWESKHGKKFGNYIKVDAFKEGKEQMLINSKNEKPDFLQVGKTIKVDVNEGKTGWYAKRVMENNFSGGGKSSFKPKMMSLTEIREYCRANSLRAIAICDDKYERSVMGAGFKDLCLFIAQGVRGEIELWGEERKDMDNRRDALLSAAERTKAEKYNDYNDLIKKASEHYDMIKGKSSK